MTPEAVAAAVQTILSQSYLFRRRDNGNNDNSHNNSNNNSHNDDNVSKSKLHGVAMADFLLALLLVMMMMIIITGILRSQTMSFSLALADLVGVGARCHGLEVDQLGWWLATPRR